MAKTESKTQKYPKLKGSIFLRCFGFPNSNTKVSIEKTTKGSDSMPKEKRSKWFSLKKILIKKNSTSVPVKAPYSKPRSKSTLQRKPQAPATAPPPPTQPPPVLPVTPSYTPIQTRHGSDDIEDTRQETTQVPAKHAKEHVRRLPKKYNLRTTSYDSVVGISVLTVTMVMMIFWGRLCAIICTSAWLYFTSRARLNVSQNNHNNKLNHNLDLELNKKKVIMEGLLDRTTPRGSNSNID